MLQTSHLTKTYTKQGKTITAASDLSLTMEAGSLTVVHGPSGSGKSTLLLMLGGMLSPSSGIVSYNGQDIYAMSVKKRSHYRKYKVGFVFQRFFLLPYLTVFDNVRLPVSLRPGASSNGERIEALVERLFLMDRLGHKPPELSVGEQQRVAIVRALMGEPEILLADEPTGNLDAENTRIISACLKEESEKGRIVVLVTHNVSLLEIATKRVHIREGQAV